MKQETAQKIDYVELMHMALNSKGELSKCYSLFHDYSILNTLYILRQLKRKNLPIEPLKGYKAWNKLNRQVKTEFLSNKTKYGFNNEHAIELLYPVFGYYPLKDENGNLKINPKTKKQEFAKYVKDFTYAKWHFTASQTDVIDTTKNTDTLIENKFNINVNDLCKKLDIEIVDYNSIDGNCQGWALTANKQLALNPVTPQPIETSIHEIAHILLEHHKADYSKRIKEVEAEMTAYIVLTICNNECELKNQIAYIQGWLGDNEFTDDMSKRIITASNKILETLKTND